MAAFALVAGGLIVLARLPLQHALGATSPFILATPGIIVAALFGGLWPAITVAFIGLWVGEWAIETGGGTPLRPAGVGIYFAFGLVFIAIVESRRRLLVRAREDADQIAELGQRLGKVARLTAMGEMAGALAHEINQPLTAIANYAGAAERLAERGETGRTITDLVKNIADQALRAREIVARIRGYVTHAAPAMAPQPLIAMFNESAAIARTGSVAGFRLRCKVQPGAEKVLADRIQIEQVLINLIRNAAEAMEGRNRRELRLSARPADGAMVEISVADNGPGVSPEIAPRLFQPFVTGKPDGMGIGLAVSRSIIEAHGGRIHVEEAPGGGAAFCFTLKRAAP